MALTTNEENWAKEQYFKSRIQTELSEFETRLWAKVAACKASGNQNKWDKIQQVKVLYRTAKAQVLAIDYDDVDAMATAAGIKQQLIADLQAIIID